MFAYEKDLSQTKCGQKVVENVFLICFMNDQETCTIVTELFPEY